MSDQACATYTGRVHVQRERLDKGGYTKRGCYFGVGLPLFCIWDDDYIAVEYRRASCRDEALEIARDIYPMATIQGSPLIISGASSPVQFWETETTDTFGGDANYSWVKRALVCTPADNDRIASRLIRQAAGIANTKTRKTDHGELIEWRHTGACMVTFALLRY
jgi:hypothetical protein